MEKENPYLKIKKAGDRIQNNPYAALKGVGGDVTGAAPRQYEETNFAKVRRLSADATEAKTAADKANSFGTIVKETLFGEKANPWTVLTLKGLRSGAFDIGKQVLTDPLASAREAAMGLANGLTLGAVDYSQRKSFINEFKKGYGGDMTDEQIEQLAQSTLAPEDPELKAIRGGADFASILVPYAATEKAFMAGIKYAAPKFVQQYGRAAQILTNIGAWNAVGQTEESFNPEAEQQRGTRAIIDTALGVAFPIAGAVFRKISPTIFKRGQVAPLPEAQQLVQSGEVISKETLVRAAQERITQMESREAALSAAEKTTLARLKANLENPDELFKLQNEGLVRPQELGNARSVVNVAREEGDDLLVATNDVQALQNYIKGSNEITYKKIASLGTDSSGAKILARHEFNPKTGQHIIYATDDVTASTLAHELGHYFDKDLTKTVSGLSRLLPEFQKNREAVEDVLSALAVSRLGGEATAKQISSEIKSIVKAITGESASLSAVRRGGAAAKNISEQFADVVSEILTREGAKGEAPTVTALLKLVQGNKAKKVLGEAMAKEVQTSKAFSNAAKKEVVEQAPKAQKLKVEAQKFDIVDDSSLGKVAVPRVSSTVSVAGKDVVVKKITQTTNGEFRLSVYNPATKKRSTIPLSNLDNIGTLQGMAKNASEKTRVISIKPTREGNIKEVTKQLDRTPTGKKPETAPIRAEKITADQETEVFLNTKVLSKITGKERIGKSNEDILTRSLSSKMTEKEWNNILSERMGNLSEDVVKAKRIINDRVQTLRDNLAGRDISSLSGVELKDITMEYEKLVETIEVFSGVRTELSNAFRSLGIEVVPGENDVLRNVVEQMQRVLGKEGDNFTFLQKALKLRENDVVDKYFTVWYPTILSGPKTTLRNIVGTSTNLASEVLSQLFTKEGRATFTDRINAMVGAGKESWNRAAATMRGDEQIISKFREGPPLRRPDFKGKLEFLNNVEYVGRFLDAQDAFFSNIAKEGEVAAIRAGNYTYGLTDKATIDAINESIGKAFGQRSSYRNQFDRTVMGELGRQVTALKNSDIGSVKFASNFIVPFVRTVANVTDRKIDYIPLLNMFRVYRGKATPFIEKRARRIVVDAGLVGAEAERVQAIVAERLWHQQMGKMWMGLSASAAIIPMAMAGRVTGAGPKDKNERDTLMLKGWRPQSLILPGGIVLPYQNLGPLSGILSMAGNISDGIKYENDDDKSVIEKLGTGIINYMRGEMDQSFLSGFSDVYDMLSPYSYRPVSDIIQEFALNAIPVPAAWTQTKDIIFPERFETRDFDEKILNRVGFTSGLEPKLDAFGNQMKADLIWGLTPRFLNTDDTVLNWMDENNVFVGRPNRKQNIKNSRTGEEREMTPEEYTQFLSATGQGIYKKLEEYVRNGTFDRYSQEKKDALVDKIVREIREQEKAKIRY